MPRPKRQVTTNPSNPVGSDEEVIAQSKGKKRPAVKEAGDDERPHKKAKAKPKSAHLNSAESTTNNRKEERSTTAAPAPTSKAQETKVPKRRGRPKGNRNLADIRALEATDEKPQDGNETLHLSDEVETAVSEDELDSVQDAPKRSKPNAPAGKRGRRKASDTSETMTDGVFEFTPKKSRQALSPAKSKSPTVPSANGQRSAKKTEADDVIRETQDAEPEVGETMLEDKFLEATHLSSEFSTKSNRDTAQRSSQGSTSEQKPEGLEESEKINDAPELRRRLEEIRRRYDALESNYRDIRETGIVEANNNIEKLRNQCEAITTASNGLVSSLKAELESQKALARQARTLQKQLEDRDTKMTMSESRADELNGQLSSAQSEIKALQTKLAAARNTAASVENAGNKVPGSTIKKNSVNRVNTAASAEAAQAAQIARLKEDLYTDLTGLIIRDVKTRDSDSLYDCIQTGVNGTLHFKLAVPQVSAADFESAEFEYIPLLDENRDRSLVAILPEYLTVDITFSRQQASNFYTRVINILTKRPANSDE